MTIREAFWRISATLLQAIAWLCIFAAIFCLLWSILIVLMQGLGWLRFGQWQSVPLHALLMSDDAQAAIQLYSRMNPLVLVPSLANSGSIEREATLVARAASSLGQDAGFFLACPLVVALIVSTCVLVFAFAKAMDKCDAAASNI